MQLIHSGDNGKTYILSQINRFFFQCGCEQLGVDPTHARGGTLSHPVSALVQVAVVAPGGTSDQ